VLIVRGGDAKGQGAGRDWLAEQLRDAGAKVDDVVAYRRIRPVWTAAQEALARRWVDDGSIWLFSSSEAVANLVASLPGQSFGQARAVATHPRIAQAAREAGFGCVLKTRPTLDDVVASIESLT
jgi:uroporphyrinogen-III synthase